jgi:AcrR family transcriptional regulator/DNA-binding MarR family transcriptional regulator
MRFSPRSPRVCGWRIVSAWSRACIKTRFRFFQTPTKAGRPVLTLPVSRAIRVRSRALYPSAPGSRLAAGGTGEMSGVARASGSARDVRARDTARVRGAARGGAVGTDDGLGRSRVSDLQRARILSATFEVVMERGAAGMSVAHVVERSGVSRRTFYEHFTGREDCLAAAFEQAVLYASEPVLGAWRSEGRWRERVRNSLIALLEFLECEPVVGRLLVVESSAAGYRTLESRRRLLGVLRGAIEQGAPKATTREAAARKTKGAREAKKTGSDAKKSGYVPSALTAEGILGGVLAVIQERLQHGEQRESPPVAGGTLEGAGGLLDLANPLMSMIVLPYEGPAAARRELTSPLPAHTATEAGQRREAVLFSDPFKDAGMRLTYRTVRVLVAIAEHPHASNRTIGDSAGITDQGQVSKLLGRLQRAGLVTNSGLGPGQGAPNAWSLTPAGDQIVHTINAHAEDTSTPAQGNSNRNGKHTERTT